MNLSLRLFSKTTSLLLTIALLLPAVAQASPQPLTPEVVHARILKRGTGNLVGVQLNTGTAFGGRIVRIDEQTFGLQTHNDPQITTVSYSDVVKLQTGPSGAFWGVMAAGIAGVVILAVVGTHELNNAKAQQPTLPALPTVR